MVTKVGATHLWSSRRRTVTQRRHGRVMLAGMTLARSVGERRGIYRLGHGRPGGSVTEICGVPNWISALPARCMVPQPDYRSTSAFFPRQAVKMPKLSVRLGWRNSYLTRLINSGAGALLFLSPSTM